MCMINTTWTTNWLQKGNRNFRYQNLVHCLQILPSFISVSWIRTDLNQQGEIYGGVRREIATTSRVHKLPVEDDTPIHQTLNWTMNLYKQSIHPEVKKVNPNPAGLLISCILQGKVQTNCNLEHKYGGINLQQETNASGLFFLWDRGGEKFGVTATRETTTGVHSGKILAVTLRPCAMSLSHFKGALACRR